MKSKTKIVDDFVLNTLEKSGLKGDDLTKHLIIWKTFYLEIKPFVGKMTSDELCCLAGKFILFVTQYEAICARAFRPSGSGSTASLIISMYSTRDLHFDGRTSPTLERLK